MNCKIAPMSAEEVKRMRDENNMPGLAYYSPNRVMALIAAYEQAEARAEHDRERLKVHLEHTATLVRLKGEEETRAILAEDVVERLKQVISSLLPIAAMGAELGESRNALLEAEIMEAARRAVVEEE